MPWTCCGTSHLDSVEACPTCGGAKRGWTVKFKKTRLFRVGASLRLSLVTFDQEPVPGEPYEVDLPNGTRVTGLLDVKGRASVKVAREGLCKVTFPRRREAAVLSLGVALPAAGGGPVPFECQTGDDDHEFQLELRLEAAASIAGPAAVAVFEAASTIPGPTRVTVFEAVSSVAGPAPVPTFVAASSVAGPSPVPTFVAASSVTGPGDVTTPPPFVASSSIHGSAS